MSRAKGLTDGFWYYHVYDVRTGKLLVEGSDQHCSEVLGHEKNYCNLFMYYGKFHDKRYQYRMDREWLIYQYLLIDKQTGETFEGSRTECYNKLREIIGKPLCHSSLHYYWYGYSGRFENILKGCYGKEDNHVLNETR